jgi:hypothetical protein
VLSLHPSGSRWWRWFGFALLSLSILLFFRRAIEHGGHFAEDAYITFRFAEHFAAGEGLVWNTGGERVEGYTSPLHVALLALAVALGAPIGPTALGIGLLSVVGLAAVYGRLSIRETGALPPLAALAFGGYLVDARLSVHATAGLDTVMYMLLLALNLSASLAFARDPRRSNAIGLAAINLLSLLGRPDAAPYIAGQGIVLGVASVRDRDRTLLRWTAGSYALLVVAGLVYLAAKVSYFGYLLPNPFYVKANEPAKLQGLPSVVKFFGGMRWLLAFLVFAPFADREALAAAWRRPRAKLQVALVLVPALAFLLYLTTVYPEVNYLSRFEYAAYFSFFVAIGALLSIGRPLERLVERRPAWTSYVAAAALIGALGGIYKAFNIWFPWFQQVETGYYRPLGEHLASTGLGPRATLIFDSAGVVPYLSRFTHVDPVGLTDNTLSGREPLSIWDREKYLWSRGADVYVGPEPPATEGATDCTDPIMSGAYGKDVLLERSRLMKAYFRIFSTLSADEICAVVHHRMRILRDEFELAGEIPFPVPTPPGFTTFAYVRKASEHRAALVAALAPLARRP